MTEEEKIAQLKKAIDEGLQSGVAKDFDAKKHLASLKAKRKE